MTDMIFKLRLFAIIEGASLLILFFGAMPLKYFFDLPQAVTYVGWVHGLLFISFVVYASDVASKKQFTDRFLFLLILSSMVPFGMLFMDRQLKRLP